MRLIVNTNRIIAALIRNSISRKIINHAEAELMSIDFANKEIEEHKEELIKKTNLNEEQFNLVLSKIKENIVNIKEELILSKIEEAKKIMDRIDKDDALFIAAALATNSDIWSDDTHFQKQNKIKIWGTSELSQKFNIY